MNPDTPKTKGPAHHSRPATTKTARNVAVLAVVTVIVLLVVILAPTKKSPPVVHHRAAAPKTLTAAAAIEAGGLPWSLQTPLSREVVLPGRGSTVTVVGGLSATQQSLDWIFTLNTATGAINTIGTLTRSIHDAAGTTLGHTGLVFGGGSPTTIAANESVLTTADLTSSTSAPLSQLPQPRSDAVAVTIGTRAYVVGGYDGTHGDTAVLSTTDGRSFSTVATLPQAVRYPAVGVLNGDLFLFGGQAVGGRNDGQALNTIQEVNPGTGTARVIGHLAQAVAGASAALVDGHLYVAGGEMGISSTSSTGTALGDIWAFNPKTNKMLHAGTLPVPMSHAGITVVGTRAWLIGGESNGLVQPTVEMFTPNPLFGQAGETGAGSPFFGDQLLIADRGNNRLVLLNPSNQVTWTYPSAYAPPPVGGFYFPDDAFFARKGSQIISNQEDNHTIVIIGFPSGKVLWQYGHPRVKSAAPGFLNTPDDAYVLANGEVTVADAYNCRILFINVLKQVVHQIGTNGVCEHKPPNYLGSPNGDTPLADGNVLISEINGSWVSEYTPTGQLVWTVKLPLKYPSDPQQIGPDRYLVSDYAHPGGIVEFTREGKILYHYQVPSGPGELYQPSLTELLPSGVFMTNDDYNDRMVAIDPATQALVWQYGVTGRPGTAPGLIAIPDGFDLLAPDGSTPTHPNTA